MARSALLNVMVQAARSAARSLVRDYGEVENLQVSVKGPADFVTAADHKAEQIVHQKLKKARPGYGFLMEESGSVEGPDKSHLWIVDPLDGTTNFLHSIPFFGVSIALEREGALVAGVIYNPISDELFTAEKGGGAFLNDRRIRVSSRRELDQSVICCGVPHIGRGDHPLFFKELSAMLPKVAGMRRTGSAALDLAWVAAGRFDGFWDRTLSPWDIAAGIVLVREAGGLVSDYDGSASMMATGNIIAGNPDIQQKICNILRAAPPAAP